VAKLYSEGIHKGVQYEDRVRGRKDSKRGQSFAFGEGFL
jgi:hypothetical protein